MGSPGCTYGGASVFGSELARDKLQVATRCGSRNSCLRAGNPVKICRSPFYDSSGTCYDQRNIDDTFYMGVYRSYTTSDPSAPISTWKAWSGLKYGSKYAQAVAIHFSDPMKVEWISPGKYRMSIGGSSWFRMKDSKSFEVRHKDAKCDELDVQFKWFGNRR